MEIVDRSNSGMVSYIHFKLGTAFDHTSGITCYDSKNKRSLKGQGDKVT